VDAPTPKRYGRGLFLATVAGGLTSIAWGKPVWTKVSAALGPAESLVPFVPQGWRIYTVSGSMPTFDRATWRLEIGGLVDRKLSLSYDDLRALPRAHQISDFHCVTGWTVKNVHWGGVRLRDVFAEAKPHQGRIPDVMLAYEMNGKPLAREHGAPLRLVIPEMYGYKNVKWLREVNLVPQAEPGYWEQLGYDRDAWVGRSNGYGA